MIRSLIKKNGFELILIKFDTCIKFAVINHRSIYNRLYDHIADAMLALSKTNEFETSELMDVNEFAERILSEIEL